MDTNDNDSIENLQWKIMKSIYSAGEDEYNSRELVYILFDSDLVIREIRFLDLHTKKPYKQKLIKAIKCTENNWHADSKSDWYLYRYVQRIIWCRLKCQNKMQRYNTKVLYLVTSSKKMHYSPIFFVWLESLLDILGMQTRDWRENWQVTKQKIAQQTLKNYSKTPMSDK